MSENPPSPYGSNPGEQPGPYGQSNPYAQEAYGQPGVPSYPGGGPQDLNAYGQQPTGMPPLANWGWRALSYLIDSVIILVPYLIVRAVAGALLSVLVSLVITVLFAYMEGTTGQTPGKKAVGTRTLRESNGQVLGFGLALGRKILHILDVIPCYLGFLWPAWDKKKQTFADKIVSSVVIKP
ncbi:RDD family protein [Streptomyces polygonati]|uniref:RDD family protein n=1 Tax=Streptomyces polygonati TaxID=1617087 RepID=A0ABV8HU01_9ACTN